MPFLSSPTTALDVLPGIVSVRITVVPVRTSTWWLVIGEPPSLPSVHETVAEALPRATLRLVGATGGPAGVTGADGADSAPRPTGFTARTWNVYVVPFVSPVTVLLNAPAAMPVIVLTTVPPTLTTICCEVTAGPPLATALVHLTVAEALPAVALTAVGAFGTDTITVWSVNLSASTLRSVSIPSLTFCGATGAPVWFTVTTPLPNVIV